MKNESTTRIYQLIEKIRINRDNAHGSQEQQWLQHHLQDPQLREVVINLSIVSLHILSTLEQGELTGIEIASQINATRGGVTRAAKKLLDNNLITAQKHLNDRKKIYYSLTKQGKQIAIAHDNMHKSIEHKIEKKLTSKYSDDELKIVANFLDDLSALEQQFGEMKK